MHNAWKHCRLAHAHAAWRRPNTYAGAFVYTVAFGHDIGYADASHLGTCTAHPHARRPGTANGHC